MSGESANARIWLNAAVFVGDVGATAPADVTTEINAADFSDLGLLSEDGMTIARSDDIQSHFAWGGILVRKTRSKHERTIKVIALEDNDVVFNLVNPGSTSETVGDLTTREYHTPTTDRRSFVIERIDGDIVSRLHVADGEILEVGDEESSDSGISTRELTITVYPASDGLLYTELSNDPGAADEGS